VVLVTLAEQNVELDKVEERVSLGFEGVVILGVQPVLGDGGHERESAQFGVVQDGIASVSTHESHLHRLNVLEQVEVLLQTGLEAGEALRADELILV